MSRKIRIELRDGAKGIGYIINPDDKTYVSGPLKEDHLQLDSDDNRNGEYVDPQKFASQLYFLLLASLNDGNRSIKGEDG